MAVPKLPLPAAASGMIAAAGALAAAWGLLVEPHLVDVCREEAEIPGLPPAWDGRRIAITGDFQVGMPFGNGGTVRRILERIIRERPAAALIAGDLVYQAVLVPRDATPAVVALLEPLVASGIPTYAVLGNHDYALDSDVSGRAQLAVAQTLADALRGAGVTVLRNESVALPAPGGSGSAGEDGPLYLAGIDDAMAGQSRPDEALADVPEGAPRIVLMHAPASFRALPPRSAPLALAGHTHGGQARAPFFHALALGRVMPGARHWPNYCDGWVRGYGQAGNRLYVNRGVGFSHVPVRFACPPELTLITLKKPNPGLRPPRP